MEKKKINFYVFRARRKKTKLEFHSKLQLYAKISLADNVEKILILALKL